MNSFAIFTDVSLNPQRRLGIGACLLVPASLLNIAPDSIERAGIKARMQFMRFMETSSTRLEVQTVLWAVETLGEEFKRYDARKLQVYTDSQCVTGLPGRRAGLETNDFIAARSGRPLTNTSLYRAFYKAHDNLGFDLIKVVGHSRADGHNSVQRIFSYVDQEVRKALTHWMGELGGQDA